MIRTLVFATAALAMAGVAVADPPAAPSTSQPTTSTAAPAAKPKHHAHHMKVDCSKDANKGKKACKTPS